MTDRLEALETLRERPTIEAWREELLRLYGGERDVSIQHLGSAEEYVAVILAQTRDRVAGLAAFQAALDRVMSSWRPELSAAPGATGEGMAPEGHGDLLLLQLVRRYMPAEGFQRVLTFAQRFIRMDLSETARRVALVTLGVLEAYLPGEGLGKVGQQRHHAYASLLQRCLAYDWCQAHAARRLNEFGILDVTSEPIVHLLSQNPTVLPQLLASYIGPVKRALPLSKLPKLYSASLRADETRAFEQAAQRWSAVVIHDDTRGATLTTSDRERVELVEVEALDQYFANRFTAAGPAAIAGLKAIGRSRASGRS